MRYYDASNGTEALAGTHFEPNTRSAHIIELPDTHEFFQYGSCDPTPDAPIGYRFVWSHTQHELIKEPATQTPEEEREIAIIREAAWVKEELEFADHEIRAIEDGDGVGNELDWRTYRVALRAWPDATGYPEIHNRPFYVTSG